MTFPETSNRILRSPLVSALAAATSLIALQGHAQTADNSWIRLRTDTAHRIFPELPAARTSSPSGTPSAATWPVSTCADDGPGSLRAAVAAAADGDSIDLTTLTCATITLETGAIEVDVDSLEFAGPGRANLAIDGNQLDRAFVHPHGGTLAFRDLTIRGGHVRATGFDVTGGGCIASAGYLVLEDAAVVNCYAGGEGAYGGGVYAYSLNMTRSSLSGNFARGIHEDAGTAAFGGGAFVYTMQLQDSTVSGNVVDHSVHEGRTSYDIGGALISVRGGFVSGSTINANFANGRGGGIATFTSMTVSNSTFSGNVAADGVGGGLFVRRPATVGIGNSTIFANHAALGGGGLWLGATSATLDSSIVQGNSADAGLPADIDDAYSLTITGSNNLIAVVGANVSVPADTLTVDAMLGPLLDNGGPTHTHALLAGSPALNAGNNAANVSFDQRGDGYARVTGTATDIGAFEQQGPNPAPTPVRAVPFLSASVMALLAACIAALGAWCRRTPGSVEPRRRG